MLLCQSRSEYRVSFRVSATKGIHSLIHHMLSIRSYYWFLVVLCSSAEKASPWGDVIVSANGASRQSKCGSVPLVPTEKIRDSGGPRMAVSL